jgi:hypothetical protein
MHYPVLYMPSLFYWDHIMNTGPILPLSGRLKSIHRWQVFPTAEKEWRVGGAEN